jgi:hypothetical protein
MIQVGTPIPTCKKCGKDAMPNTQECTQHWLERQWGDELTAMLAEGTGTLPKPHTAPIIVIEARAS